MQAAGAAILAVVDTDIFVRALLHDIGRIDDYDSSRVYAAVMSGEIVPVFSQETYDELRDILRYKIGPNEQLTEEEINEYIDDINVCAAWVVITAMVRVCKEDPHDDKFIETACVARVPYLVAMDRHFHESLETIAHLARFSVELLCPAEMLERIS
jgi:predicted nucleic acid-binding protein